MRAPRGKPSAGASVLSTLTALALALCLVGDAFAEDPRHPPPRKAARTWAQKKPPPTAQAPAASRARPLGNASNANNANRANANHTLAAAQPGRAVSASR